MLLVDLFLEPKAKLSFLMSHFFLLVQDAASVLSAALYVSRCVLDATLHAYTGLKLRLH